VKVQAGAVLAKNRFFWKWNNGATTTLAELGDPTLTTAYALCLYGSEAGVVQLLSAANIPAAAQCGGEPCWKRLSDKGFRYKDLIGAFGGVQKIILKSGDTGKAKALVKSRGDQIEMPPIPIPQEPSVVVQLVNGEGQCWDAAYTAPADGNDIRGFRDRTPP